MQDTTSTKTRELEDLSKEEWLAQVDELGEERGYFEPLGDKHSAILTDREPRLLVTFEDIDVVRETSPDDLPMAFGLADEKGWSTLCILSDGATWYRDKRVYGYFDRLIDDGFFEDFDQVVFYGAGPSAGYAAAAFSVVAPGCTVLAVQPQATLDPRVAEWDDRFTKMRRSDFNSRYGFAPDMVEAADHTYLVYDPEQNVDAMHAALFDRRLSTRLRMRHMGDGLEADLTNMGMLRPLLTAAMEGRMSAALFGRLYRARREYLPWLRRVLGKLENDQRDYLTALLCHSVLERKRGPRFKRALEQASKTLHDAGKTLPWD